MAILHEYHLPKEIDEALALAGRTESQLAFLAGGTQLIGELETCQHSDMDGVIDLRGLPLHEIARDGDRLAIGALATLTDVIEHEVAGALAEGILRRTALAECPVNLRNAATVGGLVATAEYDSEFYAALLALGATVRSQTVESESEIPLAEFSLQPRTLITGVTVSLVECRSGHARVARTPSDRPIVAAVTVAGPATTRVALCGVADRPTLADSDLSPPDNFKGSTDYRRAMAALMVERARAAVFGTTDGHGGLSPRADDL